MRVLLCLSLLLLLGFVELSREEQREGSLAGRRESMLSSTHSFLNVGFKMQLR